MLKSVKRTPWPLQPDASYKSCTSSASQLNRGKAVFEKLVAGPSRMPKNSPLTSRERRSKQKASIRQRHDGRVGLGEPKNGLRFPNFVSVSPPSMIVIIVFENTNFAQVPTTTFAIRMPVPRTIILLSSNRRGCRLKINFRLADSWPLHFLPILIQNCLAN